MLQQGLASTNSLSIKDIMLLRTDRITLRLGFGFEVNFRSIIYILITLCLHKLSLIIFNVHEIFACRIVPHAVYRLLVVGRSHARRQNRRGRTSRIGPRGLSAV